jgi:K+:H+ antiporter
MPHETALIATVAAGLGLAFVLGFLAARLRLPPLVGYLLAGVAVGPFSPGFVADANLAGQLAEIGVILLMFGVGLHFSFPDLLAVRSIALPGAAAQIAVATALGAGLARLWGWPWGAALVFGLSLSVASTVVLLRALEERGLVDSADGRIAVGWLIVEDLAMVLALVLLPALAGPLGGERPAGGGSVLGTVALTLGKVAVFVAFMHVIGRRAVPWLLQRVARLGSRELFTLGILAVALGIAVGAAALFGVSFALGAFFAGVVISESDLSYRVASDALPLQDAFAVLFFVSVGMLLDPAVLVQRPLHVLLVLVIIMVGKSVAAFAIVFEFRYPLRTALTISASLAQIGEFSFILVALGLSLNLVPLEARNLVLAGAILSITLNPFIFSTIEPIRRWLAARPGLLAWRGRPTREAPEPRGPALSGHAVIVGYGRVGGAIGEALARAGIPQAVVEQDRVTVEAVRSRGLFAVYGDAARPGILDHASTATARLLVVAAPNPFEARQIIELARAQNPRIHIVVRTHSAAEQEYLAGLKVGRAFMGERELALAMAHYALRSLGRPDEEADRIVEAMRQAPAARVPEPAFP